MEANKQIHSSLNKDRYLFRRKVFKIVGAAFHVYDENGMILLYSKQKGFKLKEDFRVYPDERMSEEILTIKTPQIIDFGATYYVNDPATGETIGAIKRKGLKSIVKDEWIFLSPGGEQIAKLTETSFLSAIVSRFVNLIPQNYVISSNAGTNIASIKQHFNPFILKYTLNIGDLGEVIDRRLVIAAGILLAAIEGRQQ